MDSHTTGGSMNLFYLDTYQAFWNNLDGTHPCIGNNSDLFIQYFYFGKKAQRNSSKIKNKKNQLAQNIL